MKYKEDMMLAIIRCVSYEEGTFYGVFEVNEKDIEALKFLAEEIRKSRENWNWTSGTELEYGTVGWESVRKVYKMYPAVSHELIDWFASRIPRNVDHIEEIKILRNYEEEKLV